MTWNNSSACIHAEPPRLRQNPALNSWLYLLLWSFASDLLSFRPQNGSPCYGPFGYIHRHTCASVWKTNVSYALNMNANSHSYTQAPEHARRTIQQPLVSFLVTSAAQMCSVVWGAAECRMFCIPSVWNMWGVPAGCPSGWISLCVMGICLPQPLVGWLQGLRHVH